MKQTEVSRATIGRVPMYLDFLLRLQKSAPQKQNISATSLAKELGLGEVQVRKDLCAVSGAGRPRTGYVVSELVTSLECFLNRDKSSGVVIMGAGKLGRALLDYEGFSEYGLEILAAFDVSVTESDRFRNGKPVLPITEFFDFCRNRPAKIGVIAVPAKNAQQVCDMLIECGIKAILCFAPCLLKVPRDVCVQYENMALSLAYLNKKV